MNPSISKTVQPQGCTNLKLRQLTRRVTQLYDARVGKSGRPQILTVLNSGNGTLTGIVVTLMGSAKKDFKIAVEDDCLTISAEKEEEKNESNHRFTRKEFSYNSFTRSFTLPQTVNADKIDATYNDGILKLSIPKKEETKLLPKKEIKIG